MKKKLNFLCITMLTLIVIEFARLCWEMKGFVKFFQHNMESIFADGSIDWVLFWVTIIAAALTLLILYLTLIRGLISFVKFMLNVNRDKIFVKDNVSLLRKTGNGIFWYNMFMLSAVLINYFTFVQMHVPQTEPIGWIFRSIIYPIILSFFCWIMAEVFAIGIKLKEEQELTI